MQRDAFFVKFNPEVFDTATRSTQDFFFEQQFHV